MLFAHHYMLCCSIINWCTVLIGLHVNVVIEYSKPSTVARNIRTNAASVICALVTLNIQQSEVFLNMFEDKTIKYRRNYSKCGCCFLYLAIFIQILIGLNCSGTDGNFNCARELFCKNSFSMLF